MISNGKIYSNYKGNNASANSPILTIIKIMFDNMQVFIE